MSLFDVSITDEKDYLKIFKDEHTIVTADDATPDSDQSYPANSQAPFGYGGNRIITHNLGFVPLVRAFWDPYHRDEWYSCRVPDPDNFGALTDPWLQTITTTTELKLMMGTDHGSQEYYIPVFYRIYQLGQHSVTTDDRIDKVFYKSPVLSGVCASNVSSLDRTYQVLQVGHDHGEPPLFTLQVSESANGPWYPEGTRIFGPPDTGSGPPGGPYASYYYIRAAMYVNANQVFIVLESNYATNKTIYVRYVLDARL